MGVSIAVMGVVGMWEVWNDVCKYKMKEYENIQHSVGGGRWFYRRSVLLMWSSLRGTSGFEASSVGIAK